MKRTLMMAGLVAGMLASAVASAQVYVGGTVGSYNWNDSCDGTVSCSKSNTGFKLLAGYAINPMFSVEASYSDLAKIKATVRDSGMNVNVEVKGKSYEIAGVARAPINADFSVFGKLGFASTKTDASVSVLGTGVNIAGESLTTPVAGLGLTYNLTKELALRGEIETRKVKFDGQKESVNNYSVGVQYAF